MGEAHRLAGKTGKNMKHRLEKAYRRLFPHGVLLNATPRYVFHFYDVNGAPIGCSRYFFRVASPPRRCRSLLLQSKTRLTSS